MASNDEDLCTSHADFAVICSFIDKFGEKLGLTLPNIGELQSSLEDTDNVSPLVSQCVSQLLRRINKSVKLDRWERGLQRFAHSYSHQDGWELERFSFKKAKLEVKIRVLKNLLEAQFDMYKSFKDKVNLLSAGELRLQPCGRDKKGVSYWCQLDECANLRVYCDDQDEETWTLVSSSREELVALIAELQSESPPGASREMSVDGSRSGTATPMGLSEAPTPVDSKAPTPVASGRTSPVIDTGQDRDSEGKVKLEEIVKVTGKVEVEKIKEKLEGENVQTVKEKDVVNVKLEVGEKVKEKLEGDVTEVQGDKLKHKVGECKMSKGNVKEERIEKENTETKLKESEVKSVQNMEEKMHVRLDIRGETDGNMETQEKAVEQITGKMEEKVLEKLTGNLEELEKNKGKMDEKEKVSVIVKEKEKVRVEVEEKINMSGIVDGNEMKRKINEKEIIDKIEEKQISVKTEEKEKVLQKLNEKLEASEKSDNKEKVPGKMEERGTDGKVKENYQTFGQMEAREGTSLKTEEKERLHVKVEKGEESRGKVEEKEITFGKMTEKDRTLGKVMEKENDIKVEEREKTGVRTEETEKISCKMQEKGKTLHEMEGTECAKIKEEVISTKDRLPELKEQRTLVKNYEESCKVPIHDGEKKEVTGKPIEHFKHSADTEKSVLGSGQKIERKPEPMTACIKPDDATKDICKDIAAKREMVVKERISSQDIHEVKDRGKAGLLEKVEVKKKESVWDKLNKMKEKGESNVLEKEPIFKDKPKRMGESEKKDNDILAHEKENSSKESSFNLHQSTSTISGQQTSKLSIEQGRVVPKDEKEKSTVKKEPHEDVFHKQEEKVVPAVSVSTPNIEVGGKLALKVSDSSQRVLDTKVKDKPIVSSVELATVTPREPPREGLSLMSVSSLATSSFDKSFKGPIAKPLFPSTTKAPSHSPVPSMKDFDIAEPPQKKLKVMDIKSHESQIESPKENKYPASVIHQQQESVGVVKATGKVPGIQVEVDRKMEKIDNVQVVQDSKTDSSSTRTDKLKTETSEQTGAKEDVRPITGGTSDKAEEEVRNQSTPDSVPRSQEKKYCDKSGESLGAEKVSITKDIYLNSGASKDIKMEAQHGAVELGDQSRHTDKPKVVERKAAFIEDEKMEVELSKSSESSLVKLPPKEEVKESLTEATKMEVESSSVPDSNTSRLSGSISQIPVKYPPTKGMKLESHPDKEKKDLIAKDASALIKMETNQMSDKVIPKSTSTEQEVGEAIEEPLMLVKGDGDGAPCEEGNPLCSRFNGEFRLPVGKPWWECFNESDGSRKIQVEEAVEEDVMYVWGDGNGVDCDAGNNGDETETTAETKQAEGGGSGTAVTTDNQGNPTPGDCKPQKEVEGIRTESDLKEVDGVAGSDEAKVNGLRTIDSVEKTDKPISWQLKPESVTDVKHLSVNGKKTDGQNCVCNDKDDGKSSTVSEKDDRIQEGNKKQCDMFGKGNKESVINDSNEMRGKEKKSEIATGNDPSVDKVELKNGEKEEKVEKRLEDKSKLMEVKKGKDSCSEVNNRNKRERDGRRQNSDESNEDEEGRYEESSKEEEDEESLSTRRGRRRSKGQRRVRIRGKGQLQKRTSGQHPQGSDGEEDDADHDEDNEDEFGRDEEGDRNDTPPPGKKRRQRGKGSTARPLPDVPRQRSARIAKIREKEEQERRHLEAMRLKQLAEENRLRELKKKAREERRSQRDIKRGRREKKDKKDREKRKKKRKKRGKKRTNPNDPWAHSSTSSSSSSEEEEEDIEEEEEEEEKLIFKSDHEFSPESDIEEADAQPIKRARTAKKVTTESEVEDEDEEEEEEEDQTQCTKCGHDDHPETILLCDNCDAGWHLSCLRPPLLSVPEGDWVCPTCEHVHLVNKLKALLNEFDECQKRAHNEELRRQRLAYVNVSLSNVIPDGRRKRRKGEDGDEDDEDETGSESDTDDSDDSDDSSGSSSQSSTDSTAPLYTLRARSSRTLKEQVEDFDEMINEAIRDEMEAAAGAGNAGRGKDIDNIIQANDGEVEEKEEKYCEEKVEVEAEQVESKETEKEIVKKEDDVEGKREREGDDDEDEDEVAPKRKKPKPAEKGTKGSGDDDYKESDENHDEESDSDEDVKMRRKKGQKYFNISVKKRRRLTDLDAEDDDDASDEDFMNSSEEEEEETEESADSSSSITTEMETDDSDVVGGKRRRSSRYDSLPLRRSARNRRGGDDDSENEERYIKKQRNKKKRRKRSSSEEDEEDMSSDSERSYRRKKKLSRKKKSLGRSRGKRGNRVRSGKKQKTKPKVKKETGEDGEEEKKPSKPRIKYSKPPKPKSEEHEEEVTQRRVTRGRQVSYFEALMMSDETEEEEPKKKWRGKVMKGEHVPTESSEYEASDDERMKRRGVSGGLGRGKVMKGEEEDEENKLGQGKKKRGRPKKGDELTDKPSPTRPSAIISTEPTPVSTPPSVPSLPVMTSISVGPVTPVVTTAPAANSPARNTPEPIVSTPPTTPAPVASSKGLPTNIAATNMGNSSPVHQPVGKWSPHISGVSGTPGTPPRPSVGSGPAPSAGTPPRPGLSGPSVTASPPPPYRSSPLPVTPVGPIVPPPSTAPSSLPPVVPPPTTTSTHSPSYPPYRPPPEHFPAHPAFPGYAPPGRHSPSPLGVPTRHPTLLPPGHSLPRIPSNYGPPPLTSAPVPGQGPYSSRGVPPHPGVLRGPPHDLYRPTLSGLTGHGSPSHPGHPHLVMKPGYPGLEPLPYASSPGPSPISLHQGSQGSPAHQSPSEDSKEETHPTGKGPGEFSSGLMSYFSSQRDDDIE